MDGLTGDYASYEELSKEYERITANLECDKFWEQEDMIKRKLLAEIAELKKEIESIKMGQESKERKWRLVENISKRMKTREKKVAQLKKRVACEGTIKRELEMEARVVQFMEGKHQNQRIAAEKVAEVAKRRKKVKNQNKKRNRAEDPSIEERANAAKRLKRKEMKIESIYQETLDDKELKQQKQTKKKVRHATKSKIENREERRVFVLKMTKTVTRIQDANEVLNLLLEVGDTNVGTTDVLKDLFRFGVLDALYGCMKCFPKHPWFSLKGIKVMNHLFRHLWDLYFASRFCLKFGFVQLAEINACDYRFDFGSVFVNLVKRFSKSF